MPKLKTHQGMKKRVKLTGTGKMKRRRAFRNHSLNKKSPARKRNYTREFGFSDGERQSVKRMMGI